VLASGHTDRPPCSLQGTLYLYRRDLRQVYRVESLVVLAGSDGNHHVLQLRLLYRFVAGIIIVLLCCRRFQRRYRKNLRPVTQASSRLHHSVDDYDYPSRLVSIRD
jgi:hypothetical protein